MRKTIYLLLIFAGVAVVAYALNRNADTSAPARLQVFHGTVPAFGDELQLTVKLPPHRAEIFARLKDGVAAAVETIAQTSGDGVRFRQLPAGEMLPVEPATWQLLQEARRLDALTGDNENERGNLLFQREGMKIGKRSANAKIDLDLLARGLAVDAAAALARKYGVADISVELGGIRRTVGEPRSETATATLGAFVNSGSSGSSSNSGKSSHSDEKVATALDAAPPRARDQSATATVPGDGATITVITRDNSVVAAGLAERLGALPDAERDAAATAAVQNFPASEVWLARKNGETWSVVSGQ